MPLYEFECGKCDTRVTLMRRMDDRDAETFCAGDFIEDPIGGAAKIINGKRHKAVKMVHIVSRLGGAYVKGPRYA